MTKRWVLLALVIAFTGCFQKKDDSGSAAADAAASANTTTPASNAVATFPDMIPQSGTRRVLQPLVVRQAPDPNAPMLTKLSAGQLVDLKGSRGAWMLIMWPSGVGQLSPGWVDLAINDPRAADVVPDAGVTTPPPDAGKPDAGRIILRKPRGK